MSNMANENYLGKRTLVEMSPVTEQWIREIVRDEMKKVKNLNESLNEEKDDEAT